MNILMVCLGNTCRSPAAEAALRALTLGWDAPPRIASAGTFVRCEGAPPDPRMVAAASEVGIAITGTTRALTVEDFSEFDLLVAVDRINLDRLHDLRPEGSTVELRLLRDDPAHRDVADPYSGDLDGYRRTLGVIRSAVERLATEVANR